MTITTHSFPMVEWSTAALTPFARRLGCGASVMQNANTMARLAVTAFQRVLGPKHTKFRQLLDWLQTKKKSSRPSGRKELQRLMGISQNDVIFRRYKF
jgi:hypothetical protein